MALSHNAARRRFLRQLGGLGTAASTAGLLDWSRLAAAATSPQDYKALVCVFLFGGSDSFNTVIPSDAGGWDTYALARRDLTIPRENLLSLTDTGHADSQGRHFGLNPSLAALHPIFESERRLAVTLNVGPLLEPLTKTQYRNGSVPRPPSLESHSDQQFQTQTAGIPNADNGFTGWHGRLLDLLESANNGASTFANVSMSGYNILQSGQRVQPFTVDPGGNIDVTLSKYATNDMQTRLRNGVRGLLQTSPHLFARAYGTTKARALEGNAALAQALAGLPVPAGFPATYLGRQLQTVARVMAVAPSLGIRRQTFFCSMGGFDTHVDQNSSQPGLLRMLADATAAFYRHTQSAGLADSVTTFTASEFGRTFAMNANQGTDHAWGGIQFVLGGAVRGGLYGAMPDQVLGGADDIGSQGRFIPTTAVDQVASTLALWYGVSASSLEFVTPRIGHFAAVDLGFMMA